MSDNIYILESKDSPLLEWKRVGEPYVEWKCKICGEIWVCNYSMESDSNLFSFFMRDKLEEEEEEEIILMVASSITMWLVPITETCQYIISPPYTDHLLNISHIMIVHNLLSQRLWCWAIITEDILSMLVSCMLCLCLVRLLLPVEL